LAKVLTAKLGQHDIGRLILGGNPICGTSHFSRAKNMWLRRLLTYDKIVELFEKCAEEGINTFLARGDDHIFKALRDYEKRGQRMNWIAQTAPERGPYAPERHPLNTPASIREIAEHKPIGIYVQGAIVDQVTNFKERRIEHIEEWLNLIRDCGLLAGIGTHNHQVLDISEERGYDPDFYMVTLNPLGYACSRDVDAISRSIQSTSKPVLAFKVLGAGRIPPEEAFKFALSRIKNSDFIVVGMVFPEEVEENAGLIAKLTKEGQL